MDICEYYTLVLEILRLVLDELLVWWVVQSPELCLDNDRPLVCSETNVDLDRKFDAIGGIQIFVQWLFDASKSDFVKFLGFCQEGKL